LSNVWTGSSVAQGGLVRLNSNTTSEFIPIKTVGDYRLWEAVYPPQQVNTVAQAKGKYISNLIAPQSGPSNLVITTSLLPDAQTGAVYNYRLLAKGGAPPYQWHPLISMPKGISITRTGHEAGRLFGVPVTKTPSYWWDFVPVIVTDKVGHSAYKLLKLNVT
jgi:hypothetical protein